MNKDSVREELLKRAIKENGILKIDCKKAYEVAYALQVKIAEVAEVIHENDIKISKCQLGCF